MLKGLFLRQVFAFIDVILAALVALTVYYVLTALFEGPAGPKVVSVTADDDLFDDVVTTLGPRGKYDVIAASGMFGPAAKKNKDTVETAPQPEALEEAQETELPLKLVGTAAADEESELATAIIFNESTNKEDTFYVGEEIIAKVKLIEVYPREVLLFNGNMNRREYLRQEEREGDAPVRVASNRPRRPERPSRSPNVITVDRQEIMQDLYDSYSDIVTNLKPELYTDEQGNVAGITASNVSDFELADKLGFQDNDVIQTINGEHIDSEEKVLEIINKYRNSTVFRIGILRDGRPQVITYRLN